MGPALVQSDRGRSVPAGPPHASAASCFSIDSLVSERSSLLAKVSGTVSPEMLTTFLTGRVPQKKPDSTKDWCQFSC